MKKSRMNRRAFLRGTGTAIALPFMESHPALQADSKKIQPPDPAVRMAMLYFPNGVWKDGWIPKQSGDKFELPFSLTPLKDLQGEINIFSNLDKKFSHEGDGHYAKTANFLTGLKVTKTKGKEINVGGISVDQYVASKLGHLTPLPSLELGIDPVISGIDSNVGYTRLYGSHISWRAANIPVAKEINPRLVYDRLFGSKDASNKPNSKRDVEDDQNLLDLALEDANRLRKKLGRDDQFKLDEYLDSIRAVERQIEFQVKNPNRQTAKIPASAKNPPIPGIPDDFRKHVKLMMDLMILAFWSDSTRVCSFMFANDVSGRNFSFLDGVRGGHHDMSHHSNEKEKIEQYQRIVRWHVEQYAELLNRLKAIQVTPERTLLDQSMIMLGSSFADGNAHEPSNLPIIVGGRAGKSWKTGQHIASAPKTPLCNLYVSMLDRMGTPVEAFGDSTGKLVK
jgi:hypothetical protein